MSTTPKTLTIEECNKLLGYLLKRSEGGVGWRYAIRTYTMAALMLDAGLRVGELVQLEIRDLYFQKAPVKTLIVRPQIAKRKRERSVPVSQRAQDALRYFLEETPWLHAADDTSYAFRVFLRHEHLTTRQVERAIRKAAMESIGRPVHPHVLRHTFASHLSRVTDIRTVQELLGHKNLSSTQVYTHPNEDDKTKAIAELQKNVTGLGTDLENLAGLSNVSDRVDTPGANHHH